MSQFWSKLREIGKAILLVYFIVREQQMLSSLTPFDVLKDIEILAILLVPLIMTLSRGHTGHIKRTVIMR